MNRSPEATEALREITTRIEDAARERAADPNKKGEVGGIFMAVATLDRKQMLEVIQALASLLCRFEAERLRDVGNGEKQT
ncbi:hypothetical protein [Mycobacterium arosiense]|uniref:hypothetical protein n=1 Tax=Mycobacterium arosiense TaxID=425468 RepID=UPI00115146F1|nr:hypothetical protein [Mycobacterium arosiense]